MSTTLNSYVSFLRIPFSFYQAEVNATQAARQQATKVALEQVKQLAEQAVQQATRAATQEVKHLAKQAAQQATEAAIEQVKQLAGNGAQQATKAAGTAGQAKR